MLSVKDGKERGYWLEVGDDSMGPQVGERERKGGRQLAAARSWPLGHLKLRVKRKKTLPF